MRWLVLRKVSWSFLFLHKIDMKCDKKIHSWRRSRRREKEKFPSANFVNWQLESASHVHFNDFFSLFSSNDVWIFHSFSEISATHSKVWESFNLRARGSIMTMIKLKLMMMTFMYVMEGMRVWDEAMRVRKEENVNEFLFVRWRWRGKLRFNELFWRLYVEFLVKLAKN